jgi:hypothetical protein
MNLRLMCRRKWSQKWLQSVIKFGSVAKFPSRTVRRPAPLRMGTPMRSPLVGSLRFKAVARGRVPVCENSLRREKREENGLPPALPRSTASQRACPLAGCANSASPRVTCATALRKAAQVTRLRMLLRSLASSNDHGVMNLRLIRLDDCPQNCPSANTTWGVRK